MIKPLLISALCLAMAGGAYGQLSSNPDKFLGNITTRGQVNGTGYEYSSLWNQITPENESKWSSIEGTRNTFTWSGCDNAYKYARDNNFPFKFHTLVWGSQYPTWMDGLSKDDQYKEIVEWMDAIKERYPDLEMIDVVNEAIVGHAPAPYKDALGGDGKTGYGWIIKAFEMAAERWPNAILIYNDYNTFQWQKSEFIQLVKTLRNAGAPIDAYGCQSHDLTDMDFDSFKSAMVEIQDALQIPMYSTEYDIGTTSDTKQEQQYKDQIKYMWEQDYVAGITLWGFIYGATWTTDGNSGIIKDSKDRPAMTWLREYMATDEAKNAKSPFPGMKKEASVYIKPQALNLTVSEETSITVNARLATKAIEKVELYVNGELVETVKETPYIVKYTPEKLGEASLKAVVYATDGSAYERVSGVNVAPPRKPFSGTPISLPGTIEAEDFDTGAEGMAFHDSNSEREGDKADYRTDTGIDIVGGNGGMAVGYTATGEWMEYTVDVTEAGYYDFDLVASGGYDNSLVSVALSDDDGLVSLADNIVIPNKGWNTYSTLHGRFAKQLEKGEQKIRITISNTGCNVDKLVLAHVDVNSNLKINVASDQSPATVGEGVTLKAEVDGATITEVNFYLNGVLCKSVSEAPFEAVIKPAAAGKYTISAEAVDADGNVSSIENMTLVVNNKRTPYKSIISLPGTLEAEDFDKCGEGMSFHDADSEDEGGSGYRTDNEGVDIVKCTGGYALGYTATGEWLEYTVNVKVAGEYSFETVVSSGSDNSGFKISLVKDGEVIDLTNKITIPNGGSWDTYTTLKGSLKSKLEVGQQVIRITIMAPYVNIDNVKFISNVNDGIEEVICDTEAVYEIYTLSGMVLGKVEASGLTELQQKSRDLVGKRGLYIVKNTTNGNAIKIMLK